MNKRIQELAIEAGYERDMFGIGHWNMPECKKFAELIVRECALIAGLMEYEGRKGIGAQILDNFGDEE